MNKEKEPNKTPAKGLWEQPVINRGLHDFSMLKQMETYQADFDEKRKMLEKMVEQKAADTISKSLYEKWLETRDGAPLVFSADPISSTGAVDSANNPCEEIPDPLATAGNDHFQFEKPNYVSAKYTTLDLAGGPGCKSDPGVFLTPDEYSALQAKAALVGETDDATVLVNVNDLAEKLVDARLVKLGLSLEKTSDDYSVFLDEFIELIESCDLRETLKDKKQEPCKKDNLSSLYSRPQKNLRSGLTSKPGRL